MPLSSSLPSSSVSLLLRDPPISQFSVEGASDVSTFGTQTLLAMRRFLDEAEYNSAASQVTKEDTNERSAEDKGEVSAEDECRQRGSFSRR